MQEFGVHCTYKYCHQKDFLPFSCYLCKHNFCIDHRTPKEHECQHETIQKKAIVCPICSKTVKYDTNISENEAWEIHMAMECNQIPTEQQKIRCSNQKCRQELKEINTYTCKSCDQKLCLKHRFPEDHICEKKGAKKQQQQQSSQINQAKPLAQEICEQCGQFFHDVFQLIKHAQYVHAI